MLLCIVVGTLINNYLTTNGPTGTVDDRAIHLLFSANRGSPRPSWRPLWHQVLTLYAIDMPTAELLLRVPKQKRIGVQ
jgi:hypothetical protein